MPFRKTYEINNREEGKAAQRDQSYRSCIIALLIFFFLCLILIIACIPWKIRNLADNTDNTYNTDQYIRQESQYGKQMITIPLTQISPITTIYSTQQITNRAKTTKEYIDTAFEEYISQDVTESYVEPSFQNTINKDEIPSAIVPKEKADHYTITAKEILQYTENAKEDIGLTIMQHNVTDIIDNDAMSTLPSTRMVHTTIKHHVNVIEPIINPKENITNEYSLNTIYNTMESEHVIENFTDFDNIKTAKVNTVTENIASTMPNDFTTLENDANTKYISDKYHHEKSQFNINISELVISTSSAQPVFEKNRNTEEFITKYSNYMESTSENHKTSINDNAVTTERSFLLKKYTSFIDEKVSPTMEIKNISKTEDSISSTNSYDIVEKYDKHVTSNIEKDENEMHISNTEEIRLPDKDTTICETGRCKQIVSKMLSYMNHSADPCEDFYEYACGGFEANPQLIDGEMVLKSKNYQRIAKQMSKREYADSLFVTYYNSCVQYEKTTNLSERIKMANDVLNTIGKFYIPATWSNNYFDFTDLFSQLILHHSALLFDVVPELDEYSPNRYTLKIGPVMYESSFIGEYVEDPCFKDEFFETKTYYVDFEVLYNDYKRCKYDTKELMGSIKEAMFNIFKDINDNYLEWHAQIEKTVHIIDSIIMQEYFSQFPSKNKIQENNLTNNYNRISLEELKNNCTFINWTQLINSLGINEINGNVQVYVHTALIESLQKLKKFSMKDPMSLNNAIMGLYAHKLYRELVVSRRNNVKDHCLQVATHLLRLEASSLYISSFADHEIVQINKIIGDTFNQLKQTLKLEIEKAQWAKKEGRERLLEKIHSLKLALPAISYFRDKDSLYNRYNMPQIFLYDNYFNNSMILLRRYRTLMYAELKGQVDDPKQIWTYYATPFQSQARVIYNLNLNVIPYGIIDWSLMNNEFSFNYFVLATLGNLIAHQIAHHFDANGIYYWNYLKNPQHTLMYKDSFTDMNFEDYMDCQKNNLYQGPINMTLPFTDQIVSFTIPQSTLNERLSDIMGLRLAYDTLVRSMSGAEKGFPWIKLRIEQLFYLVYAQMYCTKKPLTSSYVSLYESENLPNRIRVFVSASNNKPLAEMWNCATGSQIAPIDVCSVFPYLDFKETIFTITQ